MTPAPSSSRIHLPHLFRALRPSQWTKNIVVMAAFVFAFGDPGQSLSASAFLNAVMATAIFCFVSSGVYLLNDLRDIELDRAHPLKRFRPIAAGHVSAVTAGTAAAILLATGLSAALWISTPLALVIASYLVLQCAYSLWLKKVALLDVFIIAIGFVLRAAAGGIAISVTISPWLLLCTFLLALFLALCKRRHEKILFEESADNHRPSLTDYHRQLMDQLIAIVSAATIVCYSIYTLWPDTVAKFGTHSLALTIPFVIFGIFRYLDLVYRRDEGGRPEKILLTDVPLLLDLALYGVCVVAVFCVAR